jgi:hypothetical protein
VAVVAAQPVASGGRAQQPPPSSSSFLLPASSPRPNLRGPTPLLWCSGQPPPQQQHRLAGAAPECESEHAHSTALLLTPHPCAHTHRPPLQQLAGPLSHLVCEFDDTAPTEEEAALAAAARAARDHRKATATAFQELTKVWEAVSEDTSEAPPALKRLRGLGGIDMPSPIYPCIHDSLAEQQSGLRIAWSNFDFCESLVVLNDVAAESAVLTFTLVLAEKAKVMSGVLPGRLTAETATWNCKDAEDHLWVDERNLKGQLSMWNFLRHATTGMNCSLSFQHQQHKATTTVQVKVCALHSLCAHRHPN